MKKSLITFFLFAAVLINAQNRQINFEHGNLASVFAKAKKENKLIFVDAFTTWCGPCKQMARQVFTNDSVADYYNATFINLKLDMEKGEGIAFAKKYKVNCFPTLLYINGDENLVHRSAGSRAPHDFIELGKASLIPEKTYTYKKAKLEAGKLNESTILEYVDLIAGICGDPSGKIADYMKDVKDEDLLKRTNWLLMRDFMQDYQSREIKYMLANLPAYETKFGKDTVAEKIARLGEGYFSKYVYVEKFDAAGYDNAKKEFTKLNWPNSDKILFEADMNAYRRFDKPKYYALASTDFLKHFNNNAAALNQTAWNFYENVNDKDQLKAAVAMSKRACELNADYANLDTYAAVLYKSGENKEAEIQANKAIDKAKADNMGADEYKETVSLLEKIKAKK